MVIEIAGVDRLRGHCRHDRARGGVHQRAAPHSRSARRRSPRTGTPRRPSPACRSRWARTSPFLFGRELWRETRIPLFEQATDTRPDELKAQGVRPRVWFGERWITSIFDLFEENVRYFPALLPICDDEDPAATLDAGAVPGAARADRCTTARSTAGTGPIYAVVDGPAAPARGEPRPAGRPDGRRTSWPTPRSTSAWSAPWPRQDRPIWTQMSFNAAEENFHGGARRRHRRVACSGPGMGTGAGGRAGAAPPAAAGRTQGLDRWGVDPARPRPAARHHRAAAASAAATAPTGRSRRCGTSTRVPTVNRRRSACEPC